MPQPGVRLESSAARGVAILGGAGAVGRKVALRLASERRAVERIVVVDIRDVPVSERVPGVCYEVLDVRSAQLSALLQRYEADCVVHLATAISPPTGMTNHDQYSIDVDGTHNVVEACLSADVQHLIACSSGAAYGYHADNPCPLAERDPLRGNDELTHARHKRLVEEFLARTQHCFPSLRQLVFRPATILGRGTENQITTLLANPVMLGVCCGDSRFTFVLDEDVASCIVQGIHERRTGVFNLVADGVATAREIARCTGARLIELPADMMRYGLTLLRRLGLTRYGTEQLFFLQHCPVLSNDKLKREFGFAPSMTSREVFELWWGSREG